MCSTKYDRRHGDAISPRQQPSRISGQVNFFISRYLSGHNSKKELYYYGTSSKITIRTAIHGRVLALGYDPSLSVGSADVPAFFLVHVCFLQPEAGRARPFGHYGVEGLGLRRGE